MQAAFDALQRQYDELTEFGIKQTESRYESMKKTSDETDAQNQIIFLVLFETSVSVTLASVSFFRVSFIPFFFFPRVQNCEKLPKKYATETPPVELLKN